MSTAFTLELHFQDGFSGDAIEVLLEGHVVASFTARTRTQINLAHVERLEVRPDQRITIRCGQLPEHVVSAGRPPAYVVVRKVAQRLEIERTQQAPGYL